MTTKTKTFVIFLKNHFYRINNIEFIIFTKVFVLQISMQISTYRRYHILPTLRSDALKSLIKLDSAFFCQ